MTISVYTDGSANNTTRIGGYGYVILIDGKEVHRGGGYWLDTTSNRMEMQAVLDGLEWVDMNLIVTDGVCVKVVSDSRYVVDGVNRWMYGWLRRNFLGVKNKDLWKQINHQTKKQCIQVIWKKGHTKENYWNQEADNIANEYRNKLIVQA